MSSYKLKLSLKNLLKKQQSGELESSNRYLYFAFYFGEKNLPGCAAFFKHHYEEELKHFKKITEYLMERQVFYNRTKFNINLITIPGGIYDKEKEAITYILEKSLEAEVTTTESIKRIMEKARDNKDYHLENFIMWFIKEQLEEEILFDEIQTTWENMENSKLALIEFDKYLAKKTIEVHVK